MSSVTCVSGCNLPSARRRPGSVKSVGSFGSAARCERGFEFHLGRVNQFSRRRFFFFGERAELFHQRGELAVRPDPRAFGLFERGEIGRGFEFRERGLFQRFDVVEKSGHKVSKRLAARERKEHKENSGSRGRSPHQKRKNGRTFSGRPFIEFQIKILLRLLPMLRRACFSGRLWRRSPIP